MLFKTWWQYWQGTSNQVGNKASKKINCFFSPFQSSDKFWKPLTFYADSVSDVSIYENSKM